MDCQVEQKLCKQQNHGSNLPSLECIQNLLERIVIEDEMWMHHWDSVNKLDYMSRGTTINAEAHGIIRLWGAILEKRPFFSACRCAVAWQCKNLQKLANSTVSSKE